MNPRMRLVAAALLAAGLAAFLRRPVKPPTATGTWHPADPQRTHR